MRSQTTEHVEVLVTDPSRLDELLDQAEAALRQTATCQPFAGIVVTRHDHNRYTLTLSNTVPFGETREQTLA